MSDANFIRSRKNEPGGGNPFSKAGWVTLNSPDTLDARIRGLAAEPSDEPRDGGRLLPSLPDLSMLFELDVASDWMGQPDRGGCRIICGWEKGAVARRRPAVVQGERDVEGRVALFAQLLDDDGASIMSWAEARRRNLWPEWRHLGCLCVCLEVLPPMPWLLPRGAAGALPEVEVVNAAREEYVCFVSVQFSDGFLTVVRRDELIV